MTRSLTLALRALAALAAAVPASASASARTQQPLRDVAPLVSAPVADRLVTGPVARAAQAPQTFRTADGTPIAVTVSPRYGQNPAVTQTYVDFIGSLQHGAELAELNLAIVTPAEMTSRCNAGDQAILACYAPAHDLMIVPGEPIPGATVSPSYVVAHEYGHHLANHRDNAPFDALAYGPKRWASHEDVCANALRGRLAPGDEGENYLANPGEAWAETYAQLKYPQAAWNFVDLLSPSSASFAQARLDVASPWTANRTQTFRGTLTARNPSNRHTFRLRYDGALTVRLTGPANANFDLAIRSDGKDQGRTRAAGARDRIAFQAACVEEPETVAVTVTRRAGAGPYRLTVVKAG